LEIGGDDLRNLPLIERKRRLARLIDKTKKWRAIQYSGHLTGDGPCSPTSARWAWRASRLGVNPTKEGL
jgi:ATP-dependent DNA ligase